jgi:hypothetical protein
MKGNNMAKESRTSLLTYLGMMNRPGSSVGKEKRKIIEEADKGIREQDKYTNRGTRDVAESAGDSSEAIMKMSGGSYNKKKIARAMRQKLANLGM